MKLGGLLAGAAVLLTMTMGQTKKAVSEVHDVLRAKRIEMVNDNGKILAALLYLDGSARLLLAPDADLEDGAVELYGGKTDSGLRMRGEKSYYSAVCSKDSFESVIHGPGKCAIQSNVFRDQANLRFLDNDGNMRAYFRTEGKKVCIETMKADGEPGWFAPNSN